MRPSRIEYDPYKSVEEIAEKSGVSINAVRKYIAQRRIDRSHDDALITFRKVKDYLKRHEGEKKSHAQIARTLDISEGTLKKFLKMNEPPRLREGKVSALRSMPQPLHASISTSEKSILEGILAAHLGGEATYDCDLTTGKGRFYKNLPLPQNTFDINPETERVRLLEEAYTLPDASFKSIVIDLPDKINAASTASNKRNFNSFPSREDLESTYQKMISLASRLLEKDGVLVVKATDFTWREEKVWVSDLVIYLLKKFGFRIEDKFIYSNTKLLIKINNTGQAAEEDSHSYFIVGRKTEDVPTDEMFICGEEAEDTNEADTINEEEREENSTRREVQLSFDF